MKSGICCQTYDREQEMHATFWLEILMGSFHLAYLKDGTEICLRLQVVNMWTCELTCSYSTPL